MAYWTKRPSSPSSQSPRRRTARYRGLPATSASPTIGTHHENPKQAQITTADFKRRRYRRPLGAVNEYSTVSFAQDLVQMAAVVPEAVSVGGNTGEVNTFTGVDLGDITGGVYHTSDLTNPTKFVCFLYQVTLAIVPDFLRSETLGTALAGALNLLQSKISPLVDPSCASIGEFDPPRELFRVTGYDMLIDNAINPANYDDAFAAQFPGAAVGQP